MGYKVAVCGAAGGIGQPLSLLLKCNDLVDDLRCYDVAPFVPGVAVDLSHINTDSKCTGFVGDKLAEALEGADVVVIPAGVPRKPGMTRDDLFNINAGIVKTLIEGVAKNCPKAVVCVISNPVNSLVPVAAEVLKAAGCYDAKKLMGVTTLDITRAKTFIANKKGISPKDVSVNVIGGHAGKTIIPLMSTATPAVNFDDATRDALTHRIMFGGDEVVEAKAGNGSATLSMAYSGATFAISVMKAMSGEKGIVECCYSENTVCDGCSFFATPCALGPNGIEEHLPYGTLSDYEKGLLDAAIPELSASISKGVAFVQGS